MNTSPPRLAATMEAIFGPRSGPYIVAHRGASGHAPENTMVAFERALALRADALECDVHPTKDGQLVVMHDFMLNRTTNGSGLIMQHTLAEIQQLDAGSWFAPGFRDARVPILAELLAWAKGRTNLVIEIKQGPVFYPQIEQLLAQTLADAGWQRGVLVISFDHVALARFKEHAPHIPTGTLYAARTHDPARFARDVGAEVLAPHWALLTRAEVEAAHAAGLLIAPWGGAEQDYRHLFTIGVDAAIADFPDRARLLLEELPG